jgi:hypothetical protein
MPEFMPSRVSGFPPKAQRWQPFFEVAFTVEKGQNRVFRDCEQLTACWHPGSLSPASNEAARAKKDGVRAFYSTQ